MPLHFYHSYYSIRTPSLSVWDVHLHDDLPPTSAGAEGSSQKNYHFKLSTTTAGEYHSMVDTGASIQGTVAVDVSRAFSSYHFFILVHQSFPAVNTAVSQKNKVEEGLLETVGGPSAITLSRGEVEGASRRAGCTASGRDRRNLCSFALRFCWRRGSTGREKAHS